MSLSLLRLIIGLCLLHLSTGCLDIVLDIDISCSINGTDKNREKAFAKELVRVIPIAIPSNIPHRFGLLLYDSGVREVFYLDKFSSSADVIKEIEKTTFTSKKRCQTKTWKALNVTRQKYFTPENGDRNGSANIHILLADGMTAPFKERPLTLKHAQKLKDAGIETLVLGFKNKNGKDGSDELLAISTIGVEDVSEDVEVEEIVEILDRYKASRPKLLQCPEIESCITIDQPCNPNGTRFNCCEGLTCRKENDEFLCLPPANVTCIVPLDVVFMMDRSNSINETDLPFVKTFFQDFTKRFNIPDAQEENRTRIGAISFHKFAIPEFLLNEFSTEIDIVNALGNIPNVRVKKTRTDLAFKMARTMYFGTTDDRPDVPNVIIMATDGRTMPRKWGKRVLDEAQKLKDAGVSIFVMGLPNKHKKQPLEWKTVTAGQRQAEGITYVFDEKTNFTALSKEIPKITSQICK